MIKKIIISGLIAFAAVAFYKKFMAGILEPFFQEKSGKTDLMQRQIPDF